MKSADSWISPISACSPFPRPQRIAAALASADPWERYWGLIVCSSFERQATPFIATAKALALNDPEPLVRSGCRVSRPDPRR